MIANRSNQNNLELFLSVAWKICGQGVDCEYEDYSYLLSDKWSSNNITHRPLSVTSNKQYIVKVKIIIRLYVGKCTYRAFNAIAPEAADFHATAVYYEILGMSIASLLFLIGDKDVNSGLMFDTYIVKTWKLRKLCDIAVCGNLYTYKKLSFVFTTCSCDKCEPENREFTQFNDSCRMNIVQLATFILLYGIVQNDVLSYPGILWGNNVIFSRVFYCSCCDESAWIFNFIWPGFYKLAFLFKCLKAFLETILSTCCPTICFLSKSMYLQYR